MMDYLDSLKRIINSIIPTVRDKKKHLPKTTATNICNFLNNCDHNSEEFNELVIGIHEMLHNNDKHLIYPAMNRILNNSPITRYQYRFNTGDKIPSELSETLTGLVNDSSVMSPEFINLIYCIHNQLETSDKQLINYSLQRIKESDNGYPKSTYKLDEELTTYMQG